MVRLGLFSLSNMFNDNLCLVSDLLHEAFEVVETCKCKDGCVQCEYCIKRGDPSIDAMYQVFKALPVERVMKSVPSWGLEW